MLECPFDYFSCWIFSMFSMKYCPPKNMSYRNAVKDWEFPVLYANVIFCYFRSDMPVKRQ